MILGVGSALRICGNSSYQVILVLSSLQDYYPKPPNPPNAERKKARDESKRAPATTISQQQLINKCIALRGNAIKSIYTAAVVPSDIQWISELVTSTVLWYIPDQAGSEKIVEEW